MSKLDSDSSCAKCTDIATRRQGHQNLCSKHYRFRQMRSRAKRDGKVTPTHEQLELMASKGLMCPDCSREMNWLSANGQSTVATLQHYRDGALSIVCRTCNTRHAFMPGDTYRDMPKDHKLCSGCDSIKPLPNFYIDNSRSGPMKITSKCKSCCDKTIKNWRELNREKYNEYQREYRSKRKESGNPVSSGS